MHDSKNIPVTDTHTQSSGKLLGIGLAALLIIAAFFSGFQIGKDKTPNGMEASLLSFFFPTEKPAADANMSEFWQVWHLLDEKFVSSTTTTAVNTESKIQGAISGLVGSYGDPYTIYMPPAEAAQFEDDISGNFSGVGMEVGMRDGLVTVIAPLSDSPAEKAGMVAGDVIVKIDEKSTDGMNVDEAVKLIRGEKGTNVTLTVYRDGELEFKDVTITRDVITIPTVDTTTKGDVFIIRLYNFNALAETKIAEAMHTYATSKYKKLILDLRGNPGGYLQGAVAIAGNFLEPGSVVVKENYGEDIEEDVYRTQTKPIGKFDPNNFVVMIDGGSASASEILSGALSEHGAATTIGTKTFGKGSVQELVDLPSGASLKVTVARWLTPNGVSFSEGGLEPMVKISRTPQQVLKGEDPQQAAALKWLSGDHSIGEKDLEESLTGQ